MAAVQDENLSEKNIQSHLSFARKHLDDPQDFYKNPLWTDETMCARFLTSDIKVTPYFRKESYQQ